MKFRDLLKKRSVILLDGAMGTMLQPKHLKAGDIPELLNITHPEVILEVHKNYIEAGSQIIYSNTFGANRKKLPEEYTVENIIDSALKIAKKATKDTNCLVAYDMGPIGSLLEPLGDTSFEEAYDIFAEQARYAQQFGADLITIETISDLYEMKAAILASKENANLPIMATMTFEQNHRTFMGCTLPSMVATLEGLSVDALGINCSIEPQKLLPLVKELMQYATIPVIIKVNAGLPDSHTGKFLCDIKKFTTSYENFIDLGVSIIGGCCGTNPAYIKALSSLKDTPTKKSTPQVVSNICTPSNYIAIDGIKVIGERLNPTGKPLMKDALIKGDYSYIAEQAIEQINAGADILDINCGLPEIDEANVMQKLIKYLQGITDTPLQIDSANPQAIENALRVYNGKAIVNSVNGDDETLDSILPIVKKYGAGVIGLTLDKNGIPKSQDQRIRIAEKIIQRANNYGIKPSDVFIDPLTLTVSAEPKQAKITLDTLKYIKSVMGHNTVLGISNISFGLPNRELINSTFLTCALNNGLTLPIINPNIKANMDAIRAYKLLDNQDINCQDFINTFTPPKDFKPTNKSKKNHSLEYCIMNGLKEETAKATRILLTQVSPLGIVDNYLIPILDKVGNLYESGKFFLPQLILSAETAKSAFTEIRKTLSKNEKLADKGKILLATVRGDIHDIGKNIVKVVLENYGYQIIDLGKNVHEDIIIEKIKSENIRLVGLSALMTTTATNMELAIKKIKQHKLPCKIMVGGAVITSTYANKIGADFYAKDANEAVKIAKQIFSVINA